MTLLYQSLAEVLKDVRSPVQHNADVAEMGLRAHRALLDCIAANDGEAARSAMDRHLSEAARQWRIEQARPRS